ncbi:hypothetical protein EX30DRAFT_342535 [Ascodesmis nigricans]|uniref:Gamma interferon inducible lysosomal thiol reductase n=1 Tax=Ascodesmis nigricans TaxID=341454 RepID=A0A4S2MS45_9PEZI|nr:hypothetical protein EX30DRAFT_342535 [Ascodesmis nigricans]
MRPHHLVPLAFLPLTLSTPHTPVPIEIHIMSQCPDALSCWHTLISPALSRLPPTHYTFRLSFIGRSLPDGSLLCPHGATECLGDMLHLCAVELSSPPSPPPVVEYSTFTGCLLENYRSVGERQVVEGCVDENNKTRRGNATWGFEELNECVSDYAGDEGGPKLLRRSFDRSREAGVNRSCTVRIGGEVWCVRDGGEWVECPSEGSVQALVGEVERLWHGEPGVGEL